MATVEKQLVALCARKKLKLAAAESCTGGLISHKITNIPGASGVFLGGVVAYDNAVKAKLLAVPESDLLAFGAVSDTVAVAMAEGARNALAADVAVAVTGIAGPGGGTLEKPVGTVYMAVSGPLSRHVRHLRFSGNRSEIKEQSAISALSFVLEILEGV